MATVKKTKNLSAGPSKMTKKAGPIDPKGQWTEVQERTLGNMKKGGKMKKAQDGAVTKGMHKMPDGSMMKNSMMKTGGKQMIKRADGSTSQRGLWDNIRAAKGSGKKPTAAMLKQERKIKAKSK